MYPYVLLLLSTQHMDMIDAPHPLQEAGPHPLRRLQATLEILEEDPGWRRERETKVASKEGGDKGKQLVVCVCVCVHNACYGTGKSLACSQTGGLSGSAGLTEAAQTWTGPPFLPCSPGEWWTRTIDV